VPDAKLNYAFLSGTGLAVGAKQPLRINSLMFNGVTDLTAVDNTGKGGSFRVPGNVTQYQIAYNQTSTSTTSGGVTTTTTTTNTTYHTFIYQVNYDAILAWLKESPSPFPPQLRAGGILYYNSIPSTIPTNVWPLPTTTQDQKDQRFWKEYIDEALGIQQNGTSTFNGVTYATYTNIASKMGYGGFYSWNTSRIYGSIAGMEDLSPKPNVPQYDSTNAAFDQRYMDYRDNPQRPRCQMWFSPMTMVDFLGNMNVGTRAWLPGTIPESPMWQCKAGVSAALDDIRSNHPNDLITLVSFSRPEGYSPTTGSTINPGYYNSVRAPLSRDYTTMKNSLYFPTIVAQTGKEISPYDPQITDVPRSVGGTCYAMGLMLAYNQFSRPTSPADLQTFANSPAPTGQAGGLGRKGAQKLIIFETDGVCSSTAYPPGGIDSLFTNNGAYHSYFNVRYDAEGSTRNEYPTYIASGATNAATQATEVATRICGPDTGLGYSTRRKPVLINCLAFGSLFETGGGTTQAASALSLLQQLQTIGGVQTDPTTPLAPERIITGTSSDRITKMKTAFSNIMQNGYSITLID
jgi:hypothetical protein